MKTKVQSGSLYGKLDPYDPSIQSVRMKRPRTAGGPEGLVDLLRHLDEALRVLNDVDVVDAVDAPHGPAAVQAQQVDACGKRTKQLPGL